MVKPRIGNPKPTTPKPKTLTGRPRIAGAEPYRVETTLPPELEQYVQWRIGTQRDETAQAVIRRSVRMLREAEPQQ